MPSPSVHIATKAQMKDAQSIGIRTGYCLLHDRNKITSSDIFSSALYSISFAQKRRRKHTGFPALSQSSDSRAHRKTAFRIVLKPCLFARESGLCRPLSAVFSARVECYPAAWRRRDSSPPPRPPPSPPPHCRRNTASRVSSPATRFVTRREREICLKKQW